MTNPFTNKSLPDLLAMVREGVECETCKGTGGVVCECEKCKALKIGILMRCPTCTGSGKIPLPNADLNALAACVCEGRWVLHGWVTEQHFRYWRINRYDTTWYFIPSYTTDPVAAMRLQDQYGINIEFVRNRGRRALIPSRCIDTPFQESTCHAITEAALVEALTEAIEGGGE